MSSISKRALTWSAPAQFVLLGFVLPLGLSFLYQHSGWNKGPGAWNPVGIVVILAGLGLLTAALRELFKTLRNVETVDIGSPNDLVQTGPYRFARNPMYLGGALTWLG